MIKRLSLERMRNDFEGNLNDEYVVELEVERVERIERLIELNPSSLNDEM